MDLKNVFFIFLLPALFSCRQQNLTILVVDFGERYRESRMGLTMKERGRVLNWHNIPLSLYLDDFFPGSGGYKILQIEGLKIGDVHKLLFYKKLFR